MKVLVIAAHPDDEILGMGGTIKKYTSKKYQVKIVILSTGILSRRSLNFKNSSQYKMDKNIELILKKQIKQLREESKKASKILGVTNLEFFDFPDNEMDKIPMLEVVKTIEKIIEEFKPEIVYTHSPNDINIDHKIIHQATLTATRPMPNHMVKEVYSFEIPSSSEWNFPLTFTPNVFVDISTELKYKTDAMKKYKQELKKYPHPRSLEGIEVWAKRCGTICGFKAAESFYLIRKLSKI